jgi:peptidyl-prolyl isomerase G (cyclophilin G)
MCNNNKGDADDMMKSSSPPMSPYCFLKISIGGEIMEDKIIIQLDILNRPKTCSSFLALCNTTITTRRSSPQQTYRGSEFHRIVPGMCVQGGDFETFDGTGGFSPLYGRHWDDEHNNNNNNNSSNKNSSNKNNKHDQAGIVSMANPGKKNTNGSQFFITLKPTPHLDANHVVFGRVISGMDTTVQKMADVERDNRNRPVSLQRIVIEDCGLQAQLQQQSPLTDKKKKKKNKKRRRKDDDDDDDDNNSVCDTDNDSDNDNDRDDKKDDDRRRSRKRHKKEKESKKKRDKKHKRRYRDNDDDSSDNDTSSYCASSTSSSNSSNSYDSDGRKQKRKRYKKRSKGERGKHKRSKKTKNIKREKAISSG